MKTENIMFKGITDMVLLTQSLYISKTDKAKSNIIIQTITSILIEISSKFLNIFYNPFI